jgi:hypothetical protein
METFHVVHVRCGSGVHFDCVQQHWRSPAD